MTFKESSPQQEFMEERCAHYPLKTVSLEEGKIVVDEKDWQEICHVGFFKIKRPQNLNIAPLRGFVKKYATQEKYAKIVPLNEGNGFFKYEKAQLTRFVIEDDHWDKEGWTGKVSKINPNLSQEIGKEAGCLRDFGITLLQALLVKLNFPEEFWFAGTGGSACGYGSYNLSFNHYDSHVKDKDFGLGAHTDWGMITLLDTTQSGLQIEINGQWYDPLFDQEDLIVNVGEPFTHLIPSVKPGKHRVLNQRLGLRTSIAMFINPRIGAFKESANRQGQEGYVYKYDPIKKQLFDGMSVVDYFQMLSHQLMGEKIYDS